MNNERALLKPVVLILSLTCSELCVASSLLVAVASNFKPTAQLLADHYKANHAIEIKFASASTGVLFAQIRQGAPFDVFLAADTEHIQALQEAQLSLTETRITYALGELVLLVDKTALRADDLGATLQHLRRTDRRIAIANPDSAPYGRATRQAMRNLGVWRSRDKNLIRANNIALSLQNVAARTVDAAFTARSLLPYVRLRDDLAIIPVAQNLHAPIAQQAVVLRRAKHAATARAFVLFLQGSAARKIIADSGYSLPAMAAE